VRVSGAYHASGRHQSRCKTQVAEAGTQCQNLSMLLAKRLGTISLPVVRGSTLTRTALIVRDCRAFWRSFGSVLGASKREGRRLALNSGRSATDSWRSAPDWFRQRPFIFLRKIAALRGRALQILEGWSQIKRQCFVVISWVIQTASNSPAAPIIHEVSRSAVSCHGLNRDA
jgi:hypothetical protein